MKKILLVSIVSFIGLLNAKAQVVLTSSDMPELNTMQIKAKDTLTAVLVGIADTGQVWNFTAVTEHTRDTSIVMEYSDFPNTHFPTANTVVSQANGTFNGYLVNSPASFTLIGGSGIFNLAGYPTPVNQKYTPAEIMFNFPATYGDNISNSFSGEAKFYFGQTVPPGFYIDSLHNLSSVTKTTVIDASGTLTTPLGGPYNVIRVKEVKTSYDTVYAYFLGQWQDFQGNTTFSQTITYYWWANGIGTALASAVVDYNDNVLSFEWLTEFPDTPPVAASAAVLNVPCEGQCNGSATVEARWGTGPYTYSWNTSPVQTSATATGLCEGAYTVTITDSLLATTSETVTLTAPAPPAISLINTNTLSTSTGTSYQWYLGDSLLSGATNITYTVTHNGNYSVIVTRNGCTDTSAIYTYTSSGIDEHAAHSNFTVYPNPANNYVTITFNNFVPNQPVSITLQNELGQTVKNTVLNPSTHSQKTEIDITSLPKGIYFVSVQDNTSVINKKFIKQ